MPANLSIKALPLESVNPKQILSPSALLPSAHLFMLKVTTSISPPVSKLYKITVEQSNHLMQKSILFHDLATQYASVASQSVATGELSAEEEQQLVEEAQGLPMIYVEAPVERVEIIDALLDWLFSSCDADDINETLSSSLASKIQSTQDFFSLINFATLLNLFEPYCSAVDEILVYYYFGLSTEDRRTTILAHDQFIEGLLPGRFARRLVEVVAEDEAIEIIKAFFRATCIYCDEDEKDAEGYFDTYVHDEEMAFISESGFDLMNFPSPPTSTHQDLIMKTIGRENVPNTPFSPFDYAEPPTPLGSAYMCIPPGTPATPSSQRIRPRSMTIGAVTPKSPMLQHAPPNTPATPFSLLTPTPTKGKFEDNSSKVPPNTPASPAFSQSVGSPTGRSFDNVSSVPPNILNVLESAGLSGDLPNVSKTPMTSLSPSICNNLLSPSSPYLPIAPPNSPASPSKSRTVSENYQLSVPSIPLNNSKTGIVQGMDGNNSSIRRKIFEYALSKMGTRRFL
ncbi:7001_t:CDS:2 [Paraglomus brasilianum]|uniref:7001_t:CDS:1 n=1 Tax=Paraglomus brasilianum TaxID=144538 RepID=A0A9N8VPC8_9GLOM|nr:7001_t:CDS:2 [Paraglomus brasilianum]